MQAGEHLGWFFPFDHLEALHGIHFSEPCLLPSLVIRPRDGAEAAGYTAQQPQNVGPHNLVELVTEKQQKNPLVPWSTVGSGLLVLSPCR